MALAEHNYHDTNKQFTPAITYPYASTIPRGFLQHPPKFCCFTCVVPYCPGPSTIILICGWEMHYWGERLLPVLEAQTVYNKICFNSPMFAPCCEHAKSLQCISASGGPPYTYFNVSCPCLDPCSVKRPGAQVIPTYLCPSTPRTQNPFVERPSFGCACDCVGGNSCFFAKGQLSGALDYTPGTGYSICSCIGLKYLQLNGCKPEKCTMGVINPWHFDVSIDKITDGTSTTLLFAELAGRPDYWTRGVKQPPGALKTDLGFAFNFGGCWACVDSAFQIFGGCNFQGTGFAPTPQAPVCFLNCANVPNLNWYSFHPGSVGIALCDGSARTISENASLTVLCRLITFRGQAAVTDASL
jgi:hypothetical protein